MAGVEVSQRDGGPQEEEQVPGRRAVHRPVEGQTMQELLRTAAKTTGGSGWAETLQPLATFENSIVASRLSSQTMEAREGSPTRYPPSQREWDREEGAFRDRPPRIWSEAPAPATSEPHPYFQQMQALAALGSPAARDLARIIEASQHGQFPALDPSAQTGARNQSGAPQRPPHQLFLEPPLPSQQSWEVAQQLQMGAFGPFPPQSMEPPRWGGSRGPRPQARAFDVYQPPPQLSEAAQTELFRSLQMLQEAQRLSALASSQIQDAYESAGQGSNVRKRKLAEASNALTQQIGEVLAEGHEFSEKPATQVCSLCGITQTPVWRRLNKALVCNACGLKRRRSANVGRQTAVKKEEQQMQQQHIANNCPPMTATLEEVATLQEEPQQLPDNSRLEVA